MVCVCVCLGVCVCVCVCVWCVYKREQTRGHVRYESNRIQSIWNESCHLKMSPVTENVVRERTWDAIYLWCGVIHTWCEPNQHRNESQITNKWVMLHIFKITIEPQMLSQNETRKMSHVANSAFSERVLSTWINRFTYERIIRKSTYSSCHLHTDWRFITLIMQERNLRKEWRLVALDCEIPHLRKKSCEKETQLSRISSLWISQANKKIMSRPSHKESRP